MQRFPNIGTWGHRNILELILELILEPIFELILELIFDGQLLLVGGRVVPFRFPALRGGVPGQAPGPARGPAAVL